MKAVSTSIALVAAFAGLVSAAPSPRKAPHRGKYMSNPSQETSFCDLSCGNQGLCYAIYDNKNAAGQQNYNHFYEDGDNHKYSNFLPEDFKAQQPKFTGTTTKVGFSSPDPSRKFSFYPGCPAMRTDYVTINHVGYVFAQQSGEYTFKIPQADEITMLWVGDVAVRGWTRDNACLTNLYGANGEQGFQRTFTKGEYVPIRLMYANAQGFAEFRFSVTAPDTSVVVDANSENISKQLVQFSCDGKYPPFPPFGAEK